METDCDGSNLQKIFLFSYLPEFLPVWWQPSKVTLRQLFGEKHVEDSVQSRISNVYSTVHPRTNRLYAFQRLVDALSKRDKTGLSFTVEFFHSDFLPKKVICCFAKGLPFDNSPEVWALHLVLVLLLPPPRSSSSVPFQNNSFDVVDDTTRTRVKLINTYTYVI